jgi:hypothetical protein
MGGKKATCCGDGGRVTAGRCVREERAAEEEERDMVDRVRFRSPKLQWAGSLECEGRVATERADDTEVLRWDDNAALSIVGDTDVPDSGDIEIV